MSKKVFIIGGVVIILAAALAMTLPTMLAGREKENVAEVPPVVEAQRPQRRTIELNSELIGTVEPASIVYVTPMGAGEVTSVNVAVGDTVEAGQLLCVIDTKQVDAAKLSMETARVQYQDAKSNLDRMAVLHAAGDVADADYQSLADNVEMARLQYESAKLGYGIQLENSQVTAPISGYVESCDVKVHDMVSQQTMIAVISGEGGKAVTFYASERIVGGLKAGDPIRVEKNGVEHAATITEVSTMIDQQSGLFKVKASIPEGDTLATGTSVKLYVISEKAENVLTVPVDSVYYEGGAPFIYTYVDGQLKKNAVEVGLADSEYIEVKSGLNETDQVVTTWTTEFYDGSKVTLAEDASGGTGTKPEAQQDSTQSGSTSGAEADTSASTQ